MSISIPNGYNIVLGSSSQFRQNVMHGTGLKYTIISPDIDEKAIRNDNPEELVQMICSAKGEEIKKQNLVNTIIITGDQVISFQNKIREKPVDKIEAFNFIKSYANNILHTVSGLNVISTSNNKNSHGVDVCDIRVSEIPDEDINRIVENGIVMKCCGALSIEDPVYKNYCQIVKGSRDSVFGLPLNLLQSLINDVL